MSAFRIQKLRELDESHRFDVKRWREGILERRLPRREVGRHADGCRTHCGMENYIDIRRKGGRGLVREKRSVAALVRDAITRESRRVTVIRIIDVQEVRFCGCRWRKVVGNGSSLDLAVPGLRGVRDERAVKRKGVSRVDWRGCRDGVRASHRARRKMSGRCEGRKAWWGKVIEVLPGMHDKRQGMTCGETELPKRGFTTVA